MSSQLKTFIFLAVLTVLLILMGSLIGGKSGTIIAFILALIMNATAYWFSDKIVLTMYGAKEVKEAKAPELYRIVRYLANRASIPMPKIYIIPNASPNAFATGRSPSHSAVAVTTGLLKIMSEEELSGVIAHELAHIKNRDTLVQTVAATIVGALTFLAEMGRLSLFFGGIGREDEERHNPLAIIALIVMLIVMPLAATLIQLAISRTREYHADETGAKICGNPLYLANALRKLKEFIKVIPMQEANPGTAHMFIVNPLTAETLINLFSTHPPIDERIRRLERMAGKLL